MGRKIKFWTIISVVLGITYSLLSPANAHVGNNSHIPIAWYDGYGKVVFEVGPNVNAGGAFVDAGAEINVELDWPPQLYHTQCSSIPEAKCVKVKKDETCGSNCNLILWDHNSGSPDVLLYSMQRDIGYRLALRGMLQVMGMHLHHNNGVLCYGNCNWTTHMTAGEANTLNSGYADCAGCRPVGEGAEPQPSDFPESGQAPVPPE